MRTPTLIAPEDLNAAELPNGTRMEYDCQVSALAHADPLSFPILTLAGRGAGPRLIIVGGVHGDEADGIAASYNLWRLLSPEDFLGRVTVIPVANPLAFAAGRRLSPDDGLDLNRVCPGRSNGQVTERLAAALSTVIRRNADFLFTLHGWYSSGYAHPHIEYDSAPGPAQDASRAACIAAGYELIVAADWPAGLLPKPIVNAGIPAIESEIGGQGSSSAENVNFLIARTQMLMAHLGMTDHIEPCRVPRPIHRHCYVPSPTGGVLSIVSRLGEEVRVGDVLGEVYDIWGRLITTITAPETGILVTERRVQSVAMGDNLFTILVPISEYVVPSRRSS